MRTVTVPAKFGEDWFECPPSLEHGFDEGDGPGVCAVVKRTKRTITFSLNDVAFKDLKGAADYYMDAARGMDPEWRGLCQSAKRAYAILDAL